MKRLLLLLVVCLLAVCSTASAATIPATSADNIDTVYQSASPGDTIELASGSYGNVRINNNAAKSAAGAARVTIRPAAGATVTFNDLLVYASNLNVVGPITIPCCYGQPDVRAPAHDTTIQDIHATNFYVTGATKNVTIKGGVYGPYESTGGGSQIKSASNGGDGTDFPVDTVVDGVTFQKYTVPSGSTAHLDCLHVFYHQRVTIKNSHFSECEHYGILLGSNGAGRVDGDVVTNNTFDTGTFQVAGFALRGGTGEDFNDVLVQGNQGDIVTPQTTNGLTNVRFYDNNVESLGNCRSGIDYQRNVVATGDLCGSTDTRPGSTPPADTTAPDTTITTGPADSTATDASVAFTSSESGSTFECRLDGGAWASCTSPKAYSGLAVGAHTVDVRSTDLAGNVDQTPASVTWNVLAPDPAPVDSDGDGVVDSNDACPNLAGTRPDGCPDAAATIKLASDLDAEKAKVADLQSQLDAALAKDAALSDKLAQIHTLSAP